MPAITCDRGARGGRRALDDGVSELLCVPWWRARGDRVVDRSLFAMVNHAICVY